MLLIMLSIMDHNGGINELDIAKRLRDWMMQGFPELGDAGIERNGELPLLLYPNACRWHGYWYDCISYITSRLVPY